VTASGALLDEVLETVPPYELDIVWAITDVGPDPVDYREEGPRGIRYRLVVLPLFTVRIGEGVWSDAR
jgi:hypothetical protein